MSYNYTLKYKTFDQLLNEIRSDFQNYNLENYIDAQQMIKVAKRVNYDLGLRIFKTKEAVLEVEKGRVKLPDDFYTLNFALICNEFEEHMAMPQGTHIEEVPYVPVYRETPAYIDPCVAPVVNCGKCSMSPCGCGYAPPADNCSKPRVVLNCKGDTYELVQTVNTQIRTYKQFLPLRILNNAQSVDCDCPNLYWQSPENAWIKDNFLFTSFDCGNVYINYQGMLEDDNGDLLVPDHDMLNEYYEYALKQRILENLIMNDEPQATAKLQLVEARYRAARNAALSIVNTPNFAEMKQMWETNRRAQYAKYYNMFKSYPWNQFYPGNLGTILPRR